MYPLNRVYYHFAEDPVQEGTNSYPGASLSPYSHENQALEQGKIADAAKFGLLIHQ